MTTPLIILGASARAAAFSAMRAGFAPWTADLFADADLAARCPARRVAHYPRDLEQAAREAPPGPWLYTGALENHPDLVDRIAAARPLWGNPGDVLRQVRDPWQVRDALLAEGLPAPRLGANRARLPRGVWLRKPRRSAGGVHVERIKVASPAQDQRLTPRQPSSRRGGAYYQEFIPGDCTSAVFVAAQGRATLLGVTRQLIGEQWLGARGFQYGGSLGPLACIDQRESWRRLGSCLARRFALAGLFGVDAICNSEGVFPIEVNPRYTASIEILEQALGFSAVGLHAAACRDGRLPDEPGRRTTGVFGKAILYACRSGPAGAAFWRFVRECKGTDGWPPAADLPNDGETFQIGRPVLTLLARAASEGDVLRALQRQAQRVHALLDA